MTASEIKVTEYRPGMRFRIDQPGHCFDGYVGTLEFNTAGAGWLRVKTLGGPKDTQVKLECLVLVDERRVAA
jgi:hypothetical protein